MPALVFLAVVLLLRSRAQGAPAPQLLSVDYVPADEPLWSY